MLSRALILATVMHLIGCFTAAPVHAQNLEAGKSPSQIFAGTCTACHKSPRGLLKTVAAGSLTGFLRQHYTTSPEMAGLLSSYLVSNGAADTRYQGKPDKDAKSDGKPEGKPGSAPEQLDRQGHRMRAAAPSEEPEEPAKPEGEPRQAAKPDADGISPQGESGRKGRNARRLARPTEEAVPPEGEAAAAHEAGDRGPDGRRLTAKQRLSKRGKPGEEMPKEMPKGDAAKETDKETAKETGKTDAAKEEPAAAGSANEDKPAGEGKSTSSKSETAKTEAPKEMAPKEPGGQTPALRADPVPPVTPAPAAAPAASGGMPEPAAGSSTSAAKPASTAAPAASSAAQSAAAEPAPPPAAAPAPAAAVGPPEPPISR